MNLSELITNIEELALAHDQVVSFHIGESFDVATSKSTEKYPAVWFELPILSDYPDRRRKTHSLSLSFLTLAKSDDINDQMNKTSDMEELADEMMHAIDDKFQNIGIDAVSGLSLRGFSDDDLVGVRIELVFIIGRECDYKENFNIEI